ncbi:DMT family transporter [Mariprofundus erugo]|uniref:DMT family transporter n=1 Tax=Mariprofundus erugo TaxID=2528639 RepID=A0A5R9GSA2_9PROT|nr:DMT family transporter [Mariprofundus erugo]TLS66932.1 DMT family transporter [Mariprofundus erugo]
MSVPLAYIGVIMIWSTTPLAILWSGEGAGFIFGLASRMSIGAILALLTAAVFGYRLKRNHPALQAYMAAGLGIYGSMLPVYWAAQYIPSGWVSLLFGMTPLFTSLMALRHLEGETLTARKLTGMLLGVAGLAAIFATAIEINSHAAAGICAVLLSVVIHSASAVGIKRINADIPSIVLTSGGLAIAAPLLLVTWLLAGPSLPAEIPAKTAGAIIYLAIFGSVLGFALYYHVLKHVQATRVALITLITPVMALMLGHILNDEPLNGKIVTGAFMILAGLLLFESKRRPGK